jgi:histidine ammonia-lyase
LTVLFLHLDKKIGVSMGATVNEMFKIMENLERILAIELLNASQAISF